MLTLLRHLGQILLVWFLVSVEATSINKCLPSLVNDFSLKKFVRIQHHDETVWIILSYNRTC